MSGTIDERVVEMRFDNRDFEENVQTSLSTLDKLRNGLNLSDAAKGLENIGSAAKSMSFGGLSSGIEAISSRFSALEVIGITALQNITNSAINAGRQMLNSLTIEPVKEGFDEYELKMGSVQTIMASTGADLSTVMDKLNELNTYADRTIYSFSDMTTNIGKFTNAGVELNSAVAAIQGVANVAAVSGANANEASRAMYNFAQALSAGYVKLIDWKSIENANMATVEFKTQLLDAAAAAGTVQKEANGMYKVLTTDAKGKGMGDLIDATHNFNDSLQFQWMTTEVLTKTLGKYADETTDIGKKAFAAAQDVKTFSQLMDTLKEAVGSGWAETWEIVFGNFDEAKKLWTEVSNVVGGFIDTRSKARNLTLQNWKDLGGREDLIQAFRNIFGGIANIGKQAGDALKEVFKPLTGIDLADITKSFLKFSENFKITGETAQKFKNVFKGFFSIFDIGKQAISAVVEAFSPLIGRLPELGSSLLDAASNFGLWLSKVDQSIKKNNVFKNTIDSLIVFVKEKAASVNSIFQSITGLTIVEAFDKIVKKLTATREHIQEFFNSLKKVNTTEVNSLAKKIESPFTPLLSLFNGLKKIGSGIIKFLKNSVIPVLSGAVTEIGELFGFIGDKISTAADNADMSKALNIVNGGVLISIGLGIKKFIDGINGVSKDGILSNLKETIDNIKEILESVGDSLKAWQQDLKAGTLLKIAAAIGILTLSVLTLSGIEPSQIAAAMGAITAGFVELLATMTFMDKILGDSNAKSLGKLSATMIKIGVAMLILSSAIAKLSNIEPDKLANGLKAIGGALLEIVIFLGIAKTANIEKSVSGLIGLGIAMNIFAIAISNLSKMDPEKLTQGLIGLGAALTEIFLFLALTKAGDITASATGLIGLSIAMVIFTKAVSSLGKLNPDQLAHGLLGLGAALLEIAVFLAITKAVDVTSTASGLIGFSIAMNIVAAAIKNLGSLDKDTLTKGLVSLAVAMLEILVAANAMKGTLSGAAALLVIAGALAILCPVLKVLGGMSLAEIGKSLLVLAGAFTIIGVAGLLITPIVPGILAFAGSLALLGVGALACGAAVMLLATGLTALAVGGVAGITALTGLITSIIAMIPAFIQSIGQGLILLVAAIGAAAPTIMGAVTSILVAISQAVINASPELVRAAVVLIGNLIGGIAQLIPSLVLIGGEMIIAILNGFSTKLPEIIEAGVELVISFVNGVADAIRENAGPIYSAVGNLISSIVELFLTGIQMMVQGIPIVGDTLSEGLSVAKDNIRNRFTPVEMRNIASDAVGGFASGVKSGEAGIKNASSGIEKSTINELTSGNWSGGGRSIIDEFSKGMTSSSGTAKMTASVIGDNVETGLSSVDAGSIADDILGDYSGALSGGEGAVESSVKSIVSSASNTFSTSGNTSFTSAGKDNLKAYVNGITKEKKSATDASKKVATDSAKAAKTQKSSFNSAGKDGGQGYINGIKSYYDAAYKAGYGLGKKAKQGTADAQKSASPSKEFEKLGIYGGQGYRNGLLSYANRVGEAGMTLGQSAVDSARSVVSDLIEIISSDLDTEPTIRPVVDLSNVRASAGAVSGMFSGNLTFGASAKLNAISNSMQENQNGTSNDDVVRAINGLRKELSGLGGNTYHIDGITYDDGTNISEAVKTLVRATRVERRT